MSLYYKLDIDINATNTYSIVLGITKCTLPLNSILLYTISGKNKNIIFVNNKVIETNNKTISLIGNILSRLGYNRVDYDIIEDCSLDSVRNKVRMSKLHSNKTTYVSALPSDITKLTTLFLKNRFIYRFKVDGTIEPVIAPVKIDDIKASQLNTDYSDKDGFYMTNTEDNIFFLMHNVNDSPDFGGKNPPTEINKAIRQFFPNSPIVGDVFVVPADENDNIIEMSLDELKSKLRNMEMTVEKAITRSGIQYSAFFIMNSDEDDEDTSE